MGSANPGDRHAFSNLKEPPAFSTAERDRRYRSVREQLAERGVDAAVVAGSNLLYLSNALPGEMFGLLPTRAEEPLTVILTWRYLADIPVDIIQGAQNWVSDIRSGRDASPIVERLRELKLESGTVGFAGGISHKTYRILNSALPSLTIVDISDVFDNVRTLKSGEEIAFLDWSNRIFDAAVERVRTGCRPGMLGRQLIQEGRKAMWDAGGDLDATFQFNFGKKSAQNPLLAELCLERRVEDGDIGTMTAHCHYRHYGGHTDQVVVFGQPKPMHVEMFEAVKSVRNEVMKLMRAGVTQREIFDAYERACAQTGFATSPHAQMHLYGIDIPEFPGPVFRLKDPKGGKGLGGGGNFTLKSGMVYSISPTLVEKKSGEALLGGGALVVTETGYQDLGLVRPVEMVLAA
jgi:Xaa-Pro aminopeptidase